MPIPSCLISCTQPDPEGCLATGSRSSIPIVRFGAYLRASLGTELMSRKSSRVTLERYVIDWLAVMRRPGESYSDVILRLAGSIS
jgi:hypothetical protein